MDYKVYQRARLKSKKRSWCWKEQWRYAWLNTIVDMWRQPLTTLFTIIFIAISFTLPSLSYLVWKNISKAAEQWYPTPQLTAYLDKELDDDAAIKIIERLKQESGVYKVNYLSREEAMDEFSHWSGFSNAINMLEDNPLPAVAIITPKLSFQQAEILKKLCDKLAGFKGIYEVRMDDSWFTRLAAFTDLISQISVVISILMIVTTFLVIGNSIRISIFNRRNTINVMKFIGAADSFILWPFLNSGVLLGVIGAILSVIFSTTLEWQLNSVVAKVAAVFGTTFVLYGLSWDEVVLLLLLSAIMGWLAAWLATIQHLRHFTPD
ncbi:permease-like cell division protein FtsX [Candidatus Palibaumannia cicadellinicola]|uniref:Cell division protein FtsX n=1 Tax=Candidatus Palibaumannia cicadellinicola TaxID=186490 RepID=A0A088N0U1_9GAMM|nr:permease-like cell division protein FtsX [Candidatus Baumannia cicadellinicola]AIN46956.1 Cell division protein FtsX [Candidatus Baumannia cicadellinicola]